MKTWILIDNNIGHVKQAIALAKLCNLQYEKKGLKYNVLAELPPQLGLKLSIISNKSSLLDSPLPDLIISAGRRPAQVALGIKKLSPNTKIIQILNPHIGYKDIDMLVVPEHDETDFSGFRANVVRIKGAISYLDEMELDARKFSWINGYVADSSLKVAVLLGGNSKSCNFSNHHIDDLINNLIIGAKRQKTTLLITTSRRTPKLLQQKLAKSLHLSAIPHYIYDVKSASPNPYLAFLSMADVIVATGDSVSMCSEACATGKPVYIYTDQNLVHKKHYNFALTLFKHNLARQLDRSLSPYEPSPNYSVNNLVEQVDRLLSNS